MSFLNLFGGDKKVNNTTTTNNAFDQSVTKSNSDNVSNWLQNNLSQISNSTRINNTNLENTDSFNRTQLTVFSDVGNIAPGSTVSPMLDSVGIQNIFDGVLKSTNPNRIDKDPNGNAKNFDFTGTSKIAVDVIDSSGRNQLGTFYSGVNDVTRSASPTYVGNSGNPLNSPMFWPVLGLLALAAIFLLRRR
jgi:MYXO-CTERM domain-containing protein